MEVKMEVNSLRSWKLKRTFAYKQTASKAIVQPVLLVSLGSAAWLVQELHFITPCAERITSFLTSFYNSRNLKPIIYHKRFLHLTMVWESFRIFALESSILQKRLRRETMKAKEIGFLHYEAEE